MTSIDWNTIQDIKTCIVPWNVTNTDPVVQLSLNYVINNLHFQPDLAVIRNITFNTNRASIDPNIFLIWSDLTNDFIGTFVGFDGNVSAAPINNSQTIIMIKKPIDQIKFQLYQISDTAATINQPIPVTDLVSDNFSYLTITIDFIQIKNSHGIHLLHDQHSRR